MRRNKECGLSKLGLPAFESLARVGAGVGYVIGYRQRGSAPWQVLLLEAPGVANWYELAAPVQVAPGVGLARH